MTTVDVEQGIAEDHGTTAEEGQAADESDEASGIWATSWEAAASAAGAGHLLHPVYVVLHRIRVRHLDGIAMGSPLQIPQMDGRCTGRSLFSKLERALATKPIRNRAT